MAVKKKFPYRSAFVACNGGCHVTEGSSCSYGCIACGKCVESCKFGAIHLNEHGVAEVDEEKCIACGRCTRRWAASAAASALPSARWKLPTRSPRSMSTSRPTTTSSPPSSKAKPWK